MILAVAVHRLAALFLFLFVFTIDVRVKAADLSADPSADILQEPGDCLEVIESSCAVQTGSGDRFELTLSKGKVILDRDTTVIRLNDHEVRLVAGTIWVKPESKQKLFVRTEFGTASATHEFWVMKEGDRSVVSATVKETEMIGRGSQETLLVPAGLENWMGRVTKSGRASTGLPSPIQPSPHLARWARLYTGKKAQFEKEVAAFKTTWSQARGEATQIQQALFERKLASLESAANERVKSRQKVEARNRELRDLFRRRVLNAE